MTYYIIRMELDYNYNNDNIDENKNYSTKYWMTIGIGKHI